MKNDPSREIKAKKNKKGKTDENDSNQVVTTLSSSKQHLPNKSDEALLNPERQKPPPPPLPRTDSLSKDMQTDRELNGILLENSRQLKEQQLKHLGSSTSKTFSTVQSSSLQVTTNTTSNKTSKKQQAQSLNAETKQQKHHPYSTSLVNSGFGFGFDLQGGEADNQLTFIVNVKPNGDAARKGLSDGKHKNIFFVLLLS